MTTDETLRRIEQQLDEVLKLVKSAPTPTTDLAPKSVNDADLDGKYGNPEVRLVPSKWTGPDYKGWKFSDCPAEFLDEMGGMLDAISRKQSQDPAKAKFADWSAKDAARARGWAARHRANGGPSKMEPLPVGDPDWMNDAQDDPF